MANEVSWAQLASTDSNTLAAARTELHWAAQIGALVGTSLVEKQPDWSHTALYWRDEVGGLVSTSTPSGLASGLCLESFSLLALNNDRVVAELALDGTTMKGALEWLGKSLTREGYDDPSALTLTEAAAEKTDAAKGGRFTRPDEAALRELHAWYALNSPLLESMRDVLGAGANPVRCWPHHFDLATLRSLDPELDPEHARSIGVGMSPGDETYPEPYWYVLPWPKPEIGDLPSLTGGGVWHTRGFVAAVLTRSDLSTTEEPAKREKRVTSFLSSTIDSVRALLERE